LFVHAGWLYTLCRSALDQQHCSGLDLTDV